MQKTLIRVSSVMVVVTVLLSGSAQTAYGAAETTRTGGCPCPDGVTWDALAGGIVKGGHKLQLDMDMWNDFAFAATYTYGFSHMLALGLLLSGDFANRTAGDDEGFNIGIPIILSLLNNEARSMRLGITPGYFHQYYSGRFNAFWLRLEANYGMWIRKNVLMLGPAILLQLTMGTFANSSNAGNLELLFPFMGGAFAEYHVTNWVAITATMMFGLQFDRNNPDARDWAFAYRTVLGLALFVP